MVVFVPSLKKRAVGIYEYKDRNRTCPFVWRQTIKGKKYNMAFDTLDKAKAAKESKLAQIRKYGTTVLEFSESDHAEFRAAQELLPEDVSVLDAARWYVARNRHTSDKSLKDCIQMFVKFQESRNNSDRYVTEVKSIMNRLLESLGKSQIGEITRSDVLDTLISLGEVLSVRTILNLRSTWSHFFRYLVDLEELQESPMEKITMNHLPKPNGGSRKNPLELEEVRQIMALAEEDFPELAYWLALQFFVGIRSAEANRFQHEWVQPNLGRILIPGWFYENGEVTAGTKTRDDWMIDKVPENFWSWHSKYGKKRGKVEAPANNPAWNTRVRKPILNAGILDHWPHNAKRDSFCTYHLSAFRNSQATALILKHTNVTTLWKSYMGTLRSEEEGRAYFAIYPGAE